MGLATADVAAVTTTLLGWIVAIGGLRSIGLDPRDPRVHCLALAALIMLVRPTTLVLRLDQPTPDELFESRSTQVLIAGTAVMVAIWIAVFVFTSMLAAPQRPSPQTRSILPTDRRITRLLPLLAGVALLVTIPFWLRYNGPAGLIQSAKSGGLAGPARVLRAPAVLCAYVSGVIIATASERPARVRYRAWIAFGVSAGVAYTWGARDAAVFPMLAVVGHRVVSTLRSSNGRRPPARLRPLLIAALAVVGLAFGLRIARDIALTGEIQASISDESPVRQLAVANNLTQFDTFMLVVDDSPGVLQRGGWQMVGDSLAAGVPGLEADSTYLSPARVVTRFYEPRRLNGWPLSAIGDWYLALGTGGVVIGAAVSGVASAHLFRWRRRQPADRGIAADSALLIWTTTIAPIGIGMTSPARLVSIGVPSALLLIGLRAIPLSSTARLPTASPVGAST